MYMVLDEQSRKVILDYKKRRAEGKADKNGLSVQLPYFSYLVKKGALLLVNGREDYAVIVDWKKNIRVWADQVVEYLIDLNMDYFHYDYVQKAVWYAIFDEKTRIYCQEYDARMELGV